jgi:hypothetical protein
MRGDWLPEKERRWDVGQPAYPVLESGGIIFTYMGKDDRPALPAAEFFAKPTTEWALERFERGGNYLEALGQEIIVAGETVKFVAPNVLLQQSISPISPSWLRWHVAVDDSSHVEFSLRFVGEPPFTGAPHTSLRPTLLDAVAVVQAQQQAAEATEQKNN